jgi:hypothetical protein
MQEFQKFRAQSSPAHGELCRLWRNFETRMWAYYLKTFAEFTKAYLSSINQLTGKRKIAYNTA